MAKPWRLPKVFESGGDENRRLRHDAYGYCHPRVCAVMGLVSLHECEFRLWQESWGPKVPAVGGTHGWREGWCRYEGPSPAPTDRFFFHKQLQTRIGGSSITSSSPLLRACVGQPLAAAYESRNVYIVSLPDLLLACLHTRTAAEIYQEWLAVEVVIGCKSRRGSTSRP
jgi:hypothetical protein